MPPKKRKANRGKTKRQRSAKKARSRKQTIKAKGHGQSKKRRMGKTVISKRKRGSRERAANSPLSDQTLTRAGRPSPQSDFRGLSRAAEADSESVEELVEEGNIVESGAVAGVEEADSEDEREVHTRELPEDDVPEEYLEDQ